MRLHRPGHPARSWSPQLARPAAAGAPAESQVVLIASEANSSASNASSMRASTLTIRRAHVRRSGSCPRSRGTPPARQRSTVRASNGPDVRRIPPWVPATSRDRLRVDQEGDVGERGRCQPGFVGAEPFDPDADAVRRGRVDCFRLDQRRIFPLLKVPFRLRTGATHQLACDRTDDRGAVATRRVDVERCRGAHTAEHGERRVGEHVIDHRGTSGEPTAVHEPLRDGSGVGCAQPIEHVVPGVRALLVLLRRTRRLHPHIVAGGTDNEPGADLHSVNRPAILATDVPFGIRATRRW